MFKIVQRHDEFRSAARVGGLARLCILTLLGGFSASAVHATTISAGTTLTGRDFGRFDLTANTTLYNYGDSSQTVGANVDLPGVEGYLCENPCDISSIFDVTITPDAGYMLSSISLVASGFYHNFSSGGAYAYATLNVGSASSGRILECCANWYSGGAYVQTFSATINSDHSVEVLGVVRSIASAQGNCSVRCSGVEIPGFRIDVYTAVDTSAPEPSSTIPLAALLAATVFRVRRRVAARQADPDA